MNCHGYGSRARPGFRAVLDVCPLLSSSDERQEVTEKKESRGERDASSSRALEEKKWAF